MSTGIFSGVEPFHAALDYHLERHNVLAANVAHVDTPGYIPKDIARDPAGFHGALEVALARSEAGHIAITTPSVSTGRVFEDPSAGSGNDKNAVSLDREAAKLAVNQIRYDVDTALASSELSSLMFVAGDARS